MSKIETVVPGKAYEIALKHDLCKRPKTDLECAVCQALRNGEKRNKGRGYRVFCQMNKNEIIYLAEFFGAIDTTRLLPVDAQAIRTTTERMYELAGTDEKSIEKRNENRINNLKRAQQARLAKLHDETAEKAWRVVEPSITRTNCHCDLHKGMTIEDLRKLGGGCKMPQYACPTLDAYRRILDNPSKAE